MENGLKCDLCLFFTKFIKLFFTLFLQIYNLSRISILFIKQNWTIKIILYSIIFKNIRKQNEWNSFHCTLYNCKAQNVLTNGFFGIKFMIPQFFFYPHTHTHSKYISLKFQRKKKKFD